MDAIVSALGIPAGARISTRIPKKVLTEQGAPTAADKRAIQDGIEDLYWVGALKPTRMSLRLGCTPKTRTVRMITGRSNASSHRVAFLVRRSPARQRSNSTQPI